MQFLFELLLNEIAGRGERIGLLVVIFPAPDLFSLMSNRHFNMMPAMINAIRTIQQNDRLGFDLSAVL